MLSVAFILVGYLALIVAIGFPAGPLLVLAHLFIMVALMPHKRSKK